MTRFSYQAALDFLFGRINYERQRRMPYGEQSMKLDRMRSFLDRLDNPWRHYPVVHVAGTKGKGSTAAMIGSILDAAGLRVGLFSSPHLERVEQRIVTDGRPIAEDEFTALVDQVRPVVETMDVAAEADPRIHEIGPTYFEVLTAMAMLHFRDRQVDIAILEAGLGGRLDSTSVADSVLTVITSVSLDHMQQLGETTEAIAREKAGIIKPGVPVVSGVTDEAARAVIQQTCQRLGCRLIERDVDFTVDRRYECSTPSPDSPSQQFDFRAMTDATDKASLPAEIRDIPLGMLGLHQVRNAGVALGAVRVLADILPASSGRQEVPDWAAAVVKGLRRVHVPGRMEIVAERPTVLLDGAHNGASAAALVESLDAICRFCGTDTRRHLIFATTLEKDIQGMLEHLVPRLDSIVVTTYRETPRAVPAEELARIVSQRTDRPVAIAPDPIAALEFARNHSKEADVIVATGSLFLIAELRRHLVRPGNDSLFA